MKPITLRNDYHHTRTVIRTPLTAERLPAIRRRLCPYPDCYCSGPLGVRGPQDDLVAVTNLACQEQTMSVSPLYRLSIAAAECDVSLGTLRSAIQRGEIAVSHTAGGLPLVRLADVLQWKPQPRRPGPRAAARQQ